VTSTADEPVQIDGMALAYEAFQGCRHGMIGTATLLERLVDVAPQLEARRSIWVEVPGAWFRALDPYHQQALCRPLSAGEPWPRDAEVLVATMAVIARELVRLWSAGAAGAPASLGYAFHMLPGLVRSGEPFDPRQFEFSFRIAASAWTAISPETRLLLCTLTQRSVEAAEVQIASPGFAIDMFGHRDRSERGA
jgi:hypothetical protein